MNTAVKTPTGRVWAVYDTFGDRRTKFYTRLQDVEHAEGVCAYSVLGAHIREFNLAIVAVYNEKERDD